MSYLDFKIDTAHDRLRFISFLEVLDADEVGEIYAELTYAELDFVYDAYSKDHIMCVEKRDIARKIWVKKLKKLSELI